MTTVFQQAVQLIALALAFGFLNEFAEVAAFEPVQDLIWKLLMSLAFVYMATRVPSMLGNAGTFDSWLSMLYFAMNLPASMVRSAKTIGLMAGATGGAGVVWRWERWRRAPGCRRQPAASARLLPWRPRPAEETPAALPGAAGSNDQRNPKAQAGSAPTKTTTEAQRCAADGAYGTD